MHPAVECILLNKHMLLNDRSTLFLPIYSEETKLVHNRTCFFLPIYSLEWYNMTFPDIKILPARILVIILLRYRKKKSPRLLSSAKNYHVIWREKMKDLHCRLWWIPIITVQINLMYMEAIKVV